MKLIVKKGKITRIAILVFLFAFIFVFFSCGEKHPETAEFSCSNDMYGSFFYNDLYFYVGETVEDDRSTETLKYINLKAAEAKNAGEPVSGVPVYSNISNKEDDPFCPKSISGGFSRARSMGVMVDEEATEENGGIPVLLVSIPVENEESILDGNTASATCHYRLVSFNMATNKIKVLCEDMGNGGGDGGGYFVLYGDMIYYPSFSGTYDMNTLEEDGEHVLYRFPKSGGKPEQIPFPVDDISFSPRYAYGGKMYIDTADYRIYCCDLNSGDVKLLLPSQRKGSSILYKEGYIYYAGEHKISQKEGCGDMHYADIYRQPLENLKDLTEENGELCMQNACFYDLTALTSDSLIYFCQFGEGNPFRNCQTDGSILHSYDTRTGETETVFDYSDRKGISWTVGRINQKYILMSARTEQGEDYMKRSIINRATGEQWEIG